MQTFAQRARDTGYEQEGFTLIELMIGIVIIGLIVGSGAYFMMQFLEQAKVTNTQTTLKNLHTSITLYESNTGNYPTTLKDLVTQPAGEEGKGWRGPYVKKVPVDGWKKPFGYMLTPEAENPFQLYSHGGPKGKQEPKKKRISVWDVI